MHGINLKRKVNFKRKIQDGMAVTEVVEHGNDKRIIPDNRLDCQFCRRLFKPESHAIH